ncbi:unnamed protein product [Heligmosomoides polygyrus]|uniref:G protein-coupled receptor n=1 Tax=Heligmosomoides polygyrus TaxID=6339 RepID=A0A3P8AJF0_HELPZ|nr:unnamed protein product [Heligmosomoides polygyrus]
MVSFSFASDNADEVKVAIAARFGYNMSGECVSGHLDILEWKTLFTILNTTTIVAPEYVAILLLIRKIASKLNSALTYQACLPIFFVFAVMTYSIGQLNLYHHPILEYSTFILAGIVPALSPITSFRFIHPYRTWIRKELLRRHSTAAMVSETSISVLQRSFVFRRGRRDLWNSQMDYLLLMVLLHVVPNLFGIVTNSLLVFVVLKKTPKRLATYSILIFNFAFCDLLACISALFVQQRYSFMLHSYAHVLWSLLFSFSYRYYILIHTPPRSRTIVVILIIIYLPSFFQFVSFVLCATLEFGITNGILNILKWNALFTVLHMTLPVTPVYVGILILRRAVAARLSNVKTMSENTRVNLCANHGITLAASSQTKRCSHCRLRLLLTALTCQVCLPAFFLFAVVFYAIGQLNIYQHPLLEYSSFILIGFIPVLSPLTSFFFIRPYRMWIRIKLLRCGLTRLAHSENKMSTIARDDEFTQFRTIV